MIFSDLWVLAIALVLIPALYYFGFRRKINAPVQFSDVSVFKKIHSPVPVIARAIMFFLRALVIVLLLIGLARPRRGIEETQIKTEGIDIMMAVDISGSMLAEDFKLKGKRTNRLNVVKEVIKGFVKKRPNDRTGVIIFAGRPYTLCPLTLDAGVLLQFLDRAEVGLIEDSTAIGSGITTAVKRLKDSKAKSKIVILLTDGVNNAGKIDPGTAARLAKSLEIKIYTIGAGSKGPVPYPYKDPWGRTGYRNVVININDDSLREIADITGGKYYRATDTKELINIYDEIDRLEKTEIEVSSYMQYRELFTVPVMLALVLIVFEVSLRYTRFRTVP